MEGIDGQRPGRTRKDDKDGPVEAGGPRQEGHIAGERLAGRGHRPRHGVARGLGIVGRRVGIGSHQSSTGAGTAKDTAGDKVDLEKDI
jgi:hypothetical protein